MVYLLEKTTLAWSLPSFHRIILTLQWAQHPTSLEAFLSPFYPKTMCPECGGGSLQRYPSHPRESHRGFPDKYYQDWRKYSRFFPLPGELIQNKNVMCFTAGGRAN